MNMNRSRQLRDLAQRCAQLAKETSDAEIVAALDKLRRELEAGAIKAERKYQGRSDP
jgi:hypothetical protein